MEKKIKQVKLELDEKTEKALNDFLKPKDGWFKRHKKLIFGALAITVSGIAFVGIRSFKLKSNYNKNTFEMLNMDGTYYSVSDIGGSNVDNFLRDIRVLKNRTDVTKDTKLKIIAEIIK